MLVSTTMTGHDDGNHADGPFEMATWDVSRAHFYGEARRLDLHIYLEGHEQNGKFGQTLAGACMERETQRQLGETHGQKC